MIPVVRNRGQEILSGAGATAVSVRRRTGACTPARVGPACGELDPSRRACYAESESYTSRQPSGQGEPASGQFPTGGDAGGLHGRRTSPRAASAAGSGANPEPTVQSGWEKVAAFVLHPSGDPRPRVPLSPRVQARCSKAPGLAWQPPGSFFRPTP